MPLTIMKMVSRCKFRAPSRHTSVSSYAHCLLTKPQAVIRHNTISNQSSIKYSTAHNQIELISGSGAVALRFQ